MKILALTTSSNTCSVSLLDDTNVLLEKHITDAKTHSQKLMPLIDKVLNEQNMTINDIDLYACSNGPGSFTGVRIAVSTVKAFSDVTHKSIVSVSSLEGLAYNVNQSYFKKETDIICSLIDAKNDNVYFGIFKKVGQNDFEALEDFRAANINEILEFLDENYYSSPIIFVGDGAVCHKYSILSKLPKSIFVMEAFNSENSISIGKCGYYKFKKGLYGNSNSISPLYLRKSQAERALDGEK